jgi:hypothetical protein
MKPHPIESGDSVSGLKRGPMIKRTQHPINILGRGELNGQRAHHNHREFQALCLVDGHHLDVALWHWFVRVLIFVDAAFIEQTEEAVKEVKPKGLSVSGCDDGVVIIGLKDAQELGKDGHISGTVFVLHETRESFMGQELIEVVGKASVGSLSPR